MKRSVWLLTAGLLLTAFVGLSGLNPYLPGGGDNAEYIAQAEALNTLGRRANIHLAGDPDDTFRPPLYPYLLAALMRCCGRSVMLFKAVNVLFALGAVAAAWWFLLGVLNRVPSRTTGILPAGAPQPSPPNEAAASNAVVRGSGQTGKPDLQTAIEAYGDAGWIALWFALTPLSLYYAHDVLSDVPFTFLVLLALGCAARAEQPRGARWLAGSIALLALSMLLRTAALLVAGALTGYFLLELFTRRREENARGRTRTFVLFAVLTAGLLVWSARGSQTYFGSVAQPLSAGPSNVPAHESTFRRLSGRVQRQGLLYGVSLVGEVTAHDLFWPYFPVPPLPMALCHRFGMWSNWPGLIVVGLAAGWGCVVFWRRRNRLIPVVWLLHMGALLFWPFFDARFHLPVLPLFLVLVWTGARDLIAEARRHSRGVALCATFALGLLPSVCLIGALLSLSDPEAVFMSGLEWVAGTMLLSGLLIWLYRRSEGASLRRRLVTLLAVLVMSLALVRTLHRNVLHERQWGPALAVKGWPTFYAAAQLIEEQASPNDAVISAKTSLVWFWTGLKGVSIPGTTDIAVGQKSMDRARWAIVDDLPEETDSKRFLLPLLTADRVHWAVLRQIPTLDEEGQTTGMTWVFKRRETATSTSVGRTVE